MYSKLKRITAMLLVLSMTLTACASNSDNDTSTDTGTDTSTEDLYFNEEGLRICDETITVTMSGSQGGTTDWQGVAMITYIKDEMGIDIQCSPVSDDAWSTQCTLMATTDTFTDLVVNTGLTVAEINEYGEDGYAINFMDYIEYMPNFAAKLEENPSYAASITTTTGEIYCIGRLKAIMERDEPQRIYMNEIWLDNVGLEAPSTLDELYEVLTAFKNEDANGNGDANDEIPMLYATSAYYCAEEAILSAYGIYGKDESDGLYMMEDEDGQLYVANATDEYREFLTYMNTLYEEGLMEQEAFIITNDEVLSKCAQDLYGFYGTVSAPNVMAGSADKTYTLDWEIIPTLTINEDDEKFVVNESVAVTGTTSNMFISSATEYPEALCRLIDSFFVDGPEAWLGIQGVEGVTLEFLEVEGIEGGLATSYIDWEESGYSSAEEFKQQVSVIQGAFYLYDTTYARVETALMDISDEDFETLMNDHDWINAYSSGWGMLGVEYARNGEYTLLEQMTPAVYTADEISTISTYKTDILSYLSTTKAQFITGEIDVEDDAVWNTYISTLDSMGLATWLEIEQTAYDRTLSNLD